MNKLSVDALAIVLSVKDLSTTLPNLLILLLVPAILLLKTLVYVAISQLQTNGKYALPTQLAVEVSFLVPTQSLAVLTLKLALSTVLVFLYALLSNHQLKLPVSKDATISPLIVFLKVAATVALMAPTALAT